MNNAPDDPDSVSGTHRADASIVTAGILFIVSYFTYILFMPTQTALF